jgi:hypothetical protein
MRLGDDARVLRFHRYVLCLLLGACGPEACYTECRCVDFELSARSEFDRLQIFLVYGPPEDDVATPLSPELLRDGVAAPSDAVVYFASGGYEERLAPTTSYQLSDEQPHSYADAVGAVAFNARGVVGGMFEVIEWEHHQASYYTAEGTLALDRPAEVWSSAIPGVHRTCARIAGPVTTFLVTRGDRDCDGISDNEDCEPDVYCDPYATEPGAPTACRCP